MRRVVTTLSSFNMIYKPTLLLLFSCVCAATLANTHDCERTATSDAAAIDASMCETAHVESTKRVDADLVARAKLLMDASVVPRLSKFANSQIQSFLAHAGAFELPDVFRDPEWWLAVNITELRLTDIQATFGVSIDDGWGLWLNASDLGARLHYKLKVQRPVPLEFEDVMLFNRTGTSISLGFLKKVESNVPDIFVRHLNVQLGDVEPITQHHSGVPAEIERFVTSEYFHEFLQLLIDVEALPVIVTAANQQLKTAIHEQLHDFVFGVDEYVSIDMGVAADPLFSATDGIVWPIVGNSFANSEPTHVCAAASHALPNRPPTPADIAVQLDEGLVDCLLLAEQDAGNLERMLENALANINFDGRLAVHANVTVDAQTLTLSPIGVNIAFSADAGVERLFGTDEVFVDVLFNVSASASAVFGKVAQNYTISPEVGGAHLDLFVDAHALPSDFPARFRQQIASTDWKRLNGMLNAKIQTILTKSVNPSLKNKIVLPALFDEFVTDPKFVYSDHFMDIQMDLLVQTDEYDE